MRKDTNLPAMMRLVSNHVAQHFHSNRPGPTPAISAKLLDATSIPERFRQHVAAPGPARGQSHARLLRRAARPIKLRGNFQVRSRKPHPLAANIVHMRKNRHDGADSTGRLGSPRGRIEMFDKNLVHALIGGKHLNRSPADLAVDFGLTCAQKLPSLTYNTSAQYLIGIIQSRSLPLEETQGRERQMAENKTKPTKLSVAAFVNAITDPARRADARALLKLMQSASGEKPQMWGPSIVGFGRYHYRYESGREGDMPVIGFSPRKAATVLYGVAGARDSKALLAKLGKHTTGKGCLYIKKLADVDQQILAAILAKSVAATRASRAKTEQ